MKHIAAALLLALGGKEISKNFLTPDEKNINEVLASVGVKPVPSVVKQIVESTKGKKVEQV